MMDPEIVQVDLTPVHVPFKAQVQQFMMNSEGGVGMAIPVEEVWLGGDFVICQLTCNDGSVGVGEVFMWLPETGVSPNQVIDSIQNALARYILGESPFDVQRMAQRMNNNVARNEVAKGLLDMACYDLMGQLTGRPACELMGGCAVDELPLTALIPLADVELMVTLAKMYHKQGYRTFRLKLGKGITEDVAIVEAIREVLGSDVRIRVDYNQAYTPPNAVSAIAAIEPLDIEVAEQPVAAEDYLGMAYVQQRVHTPLMAHEGCFSLRDFITLVQLGAVGVLGVNLERPGGITNALHAMDYATQIGYGTVLHNQPLGINSAAQIHLAAARYHSLGHAMELTGDIMLESDLLVEPLAYENGFVKVPHGPGWGVILDQQALDYYKTSLTVTLKQKK